MSVEASAAPLAAAPEPPAVGPDGRRAWRMVQELLLQGEGHNRLARVCADYDLAPSSVKAMLRLSATHPTAMRELAAAFACDASYITAVVDALESAELAVRRPHPTDRRIRTVLLTEKGSEVAATILDRMSEPPASMWVLDEAEQRQLADLLERVAAADARVAERRARA